MTSPDDIQRRPATQVARSGPSGSAAQGEAELCVNDCGRSSAPAPRDPYDDSLDPLAAKDIKEKTGCASPFATSASRSRAARSSS